MPIIRKINNCYPNISQNSFIAENAVICGDVTIGSQTGIWYGCIARGDVQKIVVGNNTNIQDGSIIHVTRANHSANKTGEDGAPTIIGSNVTVGHLCILHGCVIEDNCFVGMGSTLMDLSYMEENSMLAAGSLVTPGKRIKRGELWGGRPAKFMRNLTEDEINYIQISADNYWKLAKMYT